MSLKPSTRHIRCCCNWGEECSQLQKQLEEYCAAEQRNDVALGNVRCTDSKSNQRLRESIIHHLHPTSVTTELYVARHHWPRPLLEHNGNKERTVVHDDDEFVVLKKIQGHGGKIKNFFTSLEVAEARSFGITGYMDRYSSERSDLFVQAPLVPKYDVQTHVLSLHSPRNDRLQMRTIVEKEKKELAMDVSMPLATAHALESTNHPAISDSTTPSTSKKYDETPSCVPVGTPTNAGGQPGAEFVSPWSRKAQFSVSDLINTGDSSTPPANEKILCQGITSSLLTNFATKSLAHRGCITQWFSYDRVSDVWRSPHCSVFAVGNNSHQCHQCGDASQSGQINMLLPNELDIIGTSSDIKSLLMREYQDLGRASFEVSEVVQGYFKVLRDVHEDTDCVELDDTYYARFCDVKESTCAVFGIAKMRHNASVGATCKNCKPVYKRLKKLTKEDLPIQELHPHHPFSKMSHIQLQDLLRKRTAQLRSNKRSLDKVRSLLLKEHDSLYIDSEDDQLHGVLKKAAQYVTDNQDEAKFNLVRALVDDNVKHRGGKNEVLPEIEEECSRFAKEIVEEITAFSLKAVGKDKQVRFSPSVMRMALSLFVKGGKTAYDIFRDTSLQAMPSISLLRKLKSKMTPEEGTFPLIYGWLCDAKVQERRTRDHDLGHIMCDEMKLKSDFYWSPTSHKCIGIVVSDTIEKRVKLADEVMKLVGDSEKQKEGKAGYSTTLSVNQFRFRSAIDNSTHAGEFFFNDGSLSGDELVRQIIQVIYGYEMIDIRIYGLLMDGGGNNARALKILRQGNEPSEGQGWLSEEQITFMNPAYPKRRVAFFHCSTHNLKNMRNQLYNSYPSRGSQAKKDFKLKKVSFGWKTVVDTYVQDQKCSLPNTSLKNGSVYPDKWSKMDVSLAKDPFKQDTIIYMIYELATHLDCIDKLNPPGGLLQNFEIVRAAASKKKR
jgi:hypothetical protein